MTVKINNGSATHRFNSKYSNKLNQDKMLKIPFASKWEKFKYIVAITMFIILFVIALSLFIARMWGLNIRALL